MKKLLPLKYWTYIHKISRNQPVKEFCTMMMEISSCPPSSARIERLFSSMASIQTKQRNRLTNDRAAKLVHVYRHYGWSAKFSNEIDLVEEEEL
jgi:hypothetical protein